MCFEGYYRSRVRIALSCPHCGFDPYLYLTDVKRARQEIEAYWRKKFAEKGIPYPGDAHNIEKNGQITDKKSKNIKIVGADVQSDFPGSGKAVLTKKS